jgi:segregation and condensation protein B
MSLSLRKAIIATLFYRGEQVSYKELASLLSTTESEIRTVTDELAPHLEELGLAVVFTEDAVELRTNSEASALIEAMRKDELTRELGKAGLEALSIIMYNGPVTRADVEYIRGVNSTAILRNLLIRGLIEKVPNPKDQRSFLYKPTIDLLSQVGVTRAEELPDYESIRAELDAFDATEAEEAVPSTQ